MKVNFTYKLFYFNKTTRLRVRRPRGFPTELEVVDAQVLAITQDDVQAALTAELVARGLKTRENLLLVPILYNMDVGDSCSIH